MRVHLKSLLLFVVTTVLISSSSSRKAGKDRCYVLALEGGGDKGAYQAGAIEGLVKYMQKNESQWDVITGVSVGALNGAGLSLFEVGKEEEAANYLVSKWRTIKGYSDVYQNWWLGPLHGLFAESGLYDTTPLKALLATFVGTGSFKRHFTVGATNIKTGLFDIFDERNLVAAQYIDAILSSAAYPVIFPNIKFLNNSYFDGGVKMSINIASGINSCLDEGYTEEEITVDAVLCNSKHLSDIDPDNMRPLSALMRVLEIFGYDFAMRDIDELKFIFRKIEFRYLVAPTRKLPSGLIPLTFSPGEIEIMIEQGIKDSKSVVEKKSGANFENLIYDYKLAKIQKFGIKKEYESRIVSGFNKPEVEERDESLKFLG